MPIPDPLNLTFDSQEPRLLALDRGGHEIIEVEADPRGWPNPAISARANASPFGLQDPQGMTVDPLTGRLFILDAGKSRIVRVNPDPTLGFEGTSAAREGRIGHIDLKPLGLVSPRGLAFNPANGHLYLLSPAQQKLYELTETGQVVSTRDLSTLRYTLRDPQAMVFAPSVDRTDDPAIMDLYIADSYLTDDGSRSGYIVELSLTEPVVLAAAVTASTASLVRTIYTSDWPNPSLDPMGICYFPPTNNLLVPDSEIEEFSQPYFRGYNLFESTLSGVQVAG